jgi:ribosomal RNA-processing protein 9
MLHTRGHSLSITSAVASETGSHLFTAGKEGLIIKWDLSTGSKLSTFHKVRLPPKQGKSKGKQKAQAQDLAGVKGHTDEVLALALSGDGKYLASGGKDRRVGVWDVEKGEWMKGFTGHKDMISVSSKRYQLFSGSHRTQQALSFRKGTNQLYTASHDRTLKLFDLTPSVFGYVETLFGHQDAVVGLDSLKAETAVSVGGRDKTVRFWKIVDESQLVFRGGGRSRVRDVLEGDFGGVDDGMERDENGIKGEKKYVEGSMECVAMVDETNFVSGGDSGFVLVLNRHPTFV